MTIESISKEDVKTRAMGWAVATVLSTAVAAGGIYGWIRQTETPLAQQCSDLRAQTLDLESQLFDEGVLGSDGGLIVRYLEVRKPDDARLRAWGELKNRRDKVCGEYTRQDRQSWDALTRIAAIGGAAFGLFSLQSSIFFNRRLRRNT